MCAAIRYKHSGKVVLMGNCHCHDCQQATGTAFASGVLVSRESVTITGNVKYYDSVGDSGDIISRGFCQNCGSRLFSKKAVGNFISITAGSLDDPNWFRPTVDFYVASAQSWDYMNPDLSKFNTLPPSNVFVSAE